MARFTEGVKTVPEEELQSLVVKLVLHYDTLSEFTCEMAFHLEALGCLVLHEEMIDDEAASGIKFQGYRLRQRMTCLKAGLKDVLEQAKTL